jgi:hypothetical protein
MGEGQPRRRPIGDALFIMDRYGDRYLLPYDRESWRIIELGRL